jgi:translation initiation factor 2B subunit (eIF-2B alpha/beta/delta family)
LKATNLLYTHCNSTVAENIITSIAKANPNLKVIADETRPRMQGRITATNLNTNGVNVIFIPDTAASSMLINNSHYPVEAVIIGADEVTFSGDAINQIGSLNVALAAYTASVPVYVVTPSLKLGVETIYTEAKIEERKDEEVWPEAPAGIEILNPVFEKVPKEFISGYITEFGLLKPEEIGNRVLKEYEWLV